MVFARDEGEGASGRLGEGEVDAEDRTQARGREDAGDRALGRDAAVAREEHRAVRGAEGKGEVVHNEDDGGTPSGKTSQKPDGADGVVGVLGAGGFVGEEGFAPKVLGGGCGSTSASGGEAEADEGSRKGGALLLACGKVGEGFAVHDAQTDLVERGVDGGGGAGWVDAFGQAEGHDVSNRESEGYGRHLRHIRDSIGTFAGGPSVHGLVGEERRRMFNESGQHFEQRGLARAVGTGKHQHAPGRHAEGDATKHRLAVVGKGAIAHVQQRCWQQRCVRVVRGVVTHAGIMARFLLAILAAYVAQDDCTHWQHWVCWAESGARVACGRVSRSGAGAEPGEGSRSAAQ